MAQRDDWRGGNAITRMGRDALDVSGARGAMNALKKSTTDSNLRMVPDLISAGVGMTRDLAVNNVLDPIAGKAIKNLAAYIMNMSLPPISFEPRTEITEGPTIAQLEPVSAKRPVPKRMLNIDTGNLEDISGRGPTPVYCILSHAWRGAEIEYTFFQKVKGKDGKRKKLEKARDASKPGLEYEIAAFQCKKYEYLANDYELPLIFNNDGKRFQKHPWSGSDVSKVMAECLQQLGDAHNAFRDRNPQEVLENYVIYNTLKSRIQERVKSRIEAMYKVLSPESLKELTLTKGLDADIVRSTAKHRERSPLDPAYDHEGSTHEFEAILSLLANDYFIDQVLVLPHVETRKLPRRNEDLDVILAHKTDKLAWNDNEEEEEHKEEGDAEEFKRRLSALAEGVLENAVDDKSSGTWNSLVEASGTAIRDHPGTDITKFKGRLRQAAEDSWGSVSGARSQLIAALEKRRSAQKVMESLRLGHELFRKHWPRYSDKKKYKRYIWNDTFCINKTVVGEHQESLAMMGEWYSNAEFCVVHIDTEPDFVTQRDSLSSWKAFGLGKSFESTPNHFAEIVEFKPYWAKRGWTLQELALSRDVFFANNVWKLLEMDPTCERGFESPELSASSETSRPSLPESSSSFAVSSVGSPTSISPQSTAPTTPSSSASLDPLGTAETPAPKKSTSIINVKCRHCQRSEHDHYPHYSKDFWDTVRSVQSTDSGLQPLTVPFERHTSTFKDIVALFSNVPPNEVCRGSDQSKLSALDILALASKRETTVETDHVYSLMGMAGNVKFAAFHAEGLTKALSRLLDEIVINSNDISVFNWSGEHFGSPLSGRSLYPKNHRAYKKPTAKKMKDAEISVIEKTLVNDKVAANLVKSYQQLEGIIEGAQAYVQTSNKTAIYILQEAFELILDHIEEKPLDLLTEKDVLPVKRAFRTITDHFQLLKDKFQPPPITVKDPEKKEKPSAEKDQPTSLKLFSPFSKTPVPKPSPSTEQSIPPPSSSTDPSTAPPTRPSAEETTPSKGKSGKWGIKSPSISAPKFGRSSSSKANQQLPPSVAPAPAASSRLGNVFGSKRQYPPPPAPVVKSRSPTMLGFLQSMNCTGNLNCLSRTNEKADDNTPIATQAAAPPAVEPQTTRSSVPVETKSKPIVDTSAPTPTEIQSSTSPMPTTAPSPSAGVFGSFSLSGIASGQTDDEKLAESFKQIVQVVLELPNTDPTKPVDVNKTALNTLIEEIEKTATSAAATSSILKDGKKKKLAASRESEDITPEASLARVISPNPIIINSSGIDAVVDIQRVKITFANVDKLRADIANAKSNLDLITGECSLSTGIAFLRIKFCATASQLKNQLDVWDVIETVKLKPNAGRQDPSKDSSKPGYFDTAKNLLTSSPDNNDNPNSGEEPSSSKGKAKEGSQVKKRSDVKDGDPDKKDSSSNSRPETKEDRDRQFRIVRTLNFVQQPDLDMLAGEWVLARFSNVVGANWFLCLFELGTTHEYYGTRIPCTNIDFDNASPEEDLRAYWKDYIREKKSGLCNLLRAMIAKKKSMVEAQEKKLEFQEKGQNVMTVGKGALGKMQEAAKSPTEETSPGSPGTPGVVDTFKTGAGNVKEAVVDAGISKMEHWGHKLSIMWHEFEEKETQRYLRDDALSNAKVPEILYPAVLGLDENKTLPAMFHAARQVHFR